MGLVLVTINNTTTLCQNSINKCVCVLGSQVLNSTEKKILYIKFHSLKNQYPSINEIEFECKISQTLKYYHYNYYISSMLYSDSIGMITYALYIILLSTYS